jgi:hypothetical protein
LVACPAGPTALALTHHRLAAFELEFEFVDQQVLDDLCQPLCCRRPHVAHFSGAAVGRRHGGGGGIRVKIVVLIR